MYQKSARQRALLVAVAQVRLYPEGIGPLRPRVGGVVRAVCVCLHHGPAFTRIVNLWVFDTPLAIFDIVLSFWLLFKGLRGTGT
jgi:hypothetical protein